MSNFNLVSIAHDSKKEEAHEKEVYAHEDAIGRKFNVETAKYNQGNQKEE